MIRLDCSGTLFFSQLDEKHLFEWAMEIPGVVGWEKDQLLVQSRRLSQVGLRGLLALFYRYNIPMQQLLQFRSPSNERWFAAPHMYWHERVFGEKPNPSIERTCPGKPGPAAHVVR